MPLSWDFCEEPDGYSERAYSDTPPPYTTNEDSGIGWFHLDEGNCRLDYYWPRADTGAPSYARIDFAGVPDPDHLFEIEGSWNSGNYSWGTAQVGLGAPGVGHAALAAPSVVVELYSDDDVTPWGPKFRGVFTNTAGVQFFTPWTALTPSSVVLPDAWSIPATTIRQWIAGGVGYVELGNGVVASVAVAGSFAGTYTRWEARHDGGGGGSSNLGGAGEGRQTASGAIVTALVALPSVLTVGYLRLDAGTYTPPPAVRHLEDGTTPRHLEDGTTERTLE